MGRLASTLAKMDFEMDFNQGAFLVLSFGDGRTLIRSRDRGDIGILAVAEPMSNLGLCTPWRSRIDSPGTWKAVEVVRKGR